jgi:hypothetical protein
MFSKKIDYIKNRDPLKFFQIICGGKSLYTNWGHMDEMRYKLVEK